MVGCQWFVSVFFIARMVVEPQSPVRCANHLPSRYLLTNCKSNLQDPNVWSRRSPTDPVAAPAFEAHLARNDFSTKNLRTVWNVIGWGVARQTRLSHNYGLKEKHEAQEAVVKVFPQWGYDMALEGIRRAHGRFRK
jgi:hypothetical protein